MITPLTTRTLAGRPGNEATQTQHPSLSFRGRFESIFRFLVKLESLDTFRVLKTYIGGGSWFQVGGGGGGGKLSAHDCSTFP